MVTFENKIKKALLLSTVAHAASAASVAARSSLATHIAMILPKLAVEPILNVPNPSFVKRASDNHTMSTEVLVSHLASNRSGNLSTTLIAPVASLARTAVSVGPGHLCSNPKHCDMSPPASSSTLTPFVAANTTL